MGCFVRGVKKWHGMFCLGMFCPAPQVVDGWLAGWLAGGRAGGGTTDGQICIFTVARIVMHHAKNREWTKAHWDKSPLGQKPTGQYPTGKKSTA